MVHGCDICEYELENECEYMSNYVQYTNISLGLYSFLFLCIPACPICIIYVIENMSPQFCLFSLEDAVRDCADARSAMTADP